MELEPLRFPATPKRKQSALPALAGAAVGASFALAFYSKFTIGMVPRIILYWIIAIAVHEGAHAIAGALVGFRLISLYLGPLHITRESGPLRLRFSSWFAFRGACLSVPSGWDETFRRKRAIFIAAGPLANIVTAPLGPPLFSAVSLAAGLLSLVPLKNSSSDGRQLFESRDEARVRVAALALLAQTLPPREWPPELVASARSLDDTTGSMLSYWHALHEGDLPLAHAMLQRAIDTATPLRFPHIALEAATFEAAWRGDAAAAKLWSARATKSDKHGRQLLEAAIDLTKALPDEKNVARASVILRQPTIERITTRRQAAAIR